MKYVLTIVINLIITFHTLGQDYEKVCRSLNYPPSLILIAMHNTLNENLMVYNSYKRLSIEGQCYLETKRGLTRIKIIPDTSDSYVTKNETYNQYYKNYYDNQNRLIKSRYTNFVGEYFYDIQSRLIEIKSYFDNYNLDSTRNIYQWDQPDGWRGKYNDNGDLVEEVTTWKGRPDFTTRYTFKDNKIITSELINYLNKEGRFEKHIYSYNGDILSKVDSFNENGKKLYTIYYEWRYK